MRKLLLILLIAGGLAFLLTPLVVSASGSGAVRPVEPTAPEPVVIQLGENGERSGPGSLGVEVVELTEQLRLRFSVPEGRGVLISEVVSESAAENAGIEAGDVLVSLGGAPIASAWELRRRVSDAGAGNQVPLVVIRDGGLVELSAILDGRGRRWASRFDDDEMSRRFEEVGAQLEAALSAADWERFGEGWERSEQDWDRFGERWERLGERLGERFERLGERMGRRFEELGERMEDRADRWENDFERSGEDWERFGEEMERLGEEWGRFGEELGRQFEDVDWGAFSAEISAAVQEAVGSVDWQQLGESIREAVEHLDVHLEGHRE